MTTGCIIARIAGGIAWFIVGFIAAAIRITDQASAGSFIACAIIGLLFSAIYTAVILW